MKRPMDNINDHNNIQSRLAPLDQSLSGKIVNWIRVVVTILIVMMIITIMLNMHRLRSRRVVSTTTIVCRIKFGAIELFLS